jgi:hypothetical protein
VGVPVKEKKWHTRLLQGGLFRNYEPPQSHEYKRYQHYNTMHVVGFSVDKFTDPVGSDTNVKTEINPTEAKNNDRNVGRT